MTRMSIIELTFVSYYFVKFNDIIVIGDYMFKEYRLKKGLTLEQLAELCEISWRNLFRIENGNYRYAKFETIAKLFTILEFSKEDILKVITEISK